MDVQAAVDRGTKLLNAFSPHWFTVIDLAKFDIEICTDCIVGQVIPGRNFGEACTILGVPDSNNSYVYGFDVEESAMEAEELEAVWVARIEELLAGELVSQMDASFTDG